ncbi:hypothetical protein Pint_06675 [Pistacia integerrima]|uniref:Uncharacterized protein n=1 Tax=Pistacia integerrima TaxID=434235 RepID=A0ACC0Z3Q1_9ROSI|nr:hypothetical protein Pint_06675 [Pistacia integerrima]
MKGRKKKKKKGLKACCLWPCYAVCSVCRGVGRCLFVSCYPVLQCFGCDDRRHQHHHHRHFH